MNKGEGQHLIPNYIFPENGRKKSFAKYKIPKKGKQQIEIAKLPKTAGHEQNQPKKHKNAKLAQKEQYQQKKLANKEQNQQKIAKKAKLAK